jgi:hypothetical protein
LDVLDKEIKDIVSTIGFALCKMNEQSVMEQIDNLTLKKRQLKNNIFFIFKARYTLQLRGKINLIILLYAERLWNRVYA